MVSSNRAFINGPSKNCGGENKPRIPLRRPWGPDEIKGPSGSARRSSKRVPREVRLTGNRVLGPLKGDRQDKDKHIFLSATGIRMVSSGGCEHPLKSKDHWQ